MATRGFENFTATDAARHALKHARQDARMPAGKTSGRSKYGAVKTVVDGITFDSKREAARYSELKLQERAGLIKKLELQPVFILSVPWHMGGMNAVIGEYRGDFRYFERHGDRETGYGFRTVVEDVKGFKTAVYRLKKKHVEAQYGIQIREIR